MRSLATSMVSPSMMRGWPVTASVAVAVDSERVSAWALDERGQRAEELQVASDDGRALLQLGPPYRTLWYEVEIR